MSLSTKSHSDLMACRDAILVAFRAEQMKRSSRNLDWIENERQAVAGAATTWAAKNDYDVVVTARDVEHIEVLAIGHYDYTTKLALYVAEHVIRGGDLRP